jgi:hypothetical protein
MPIWGLSDNDVWFGIQGPRGLPIQAESFSLMRLSSSLGEPVFYPKTGEFYSTEYGSQSFLLVSNETTITMTWRHDLGINGSYGFSFP